MFKLPDLGNVPTSKPKQKPDQGGVPYFQFQDFTAINDIGCGGFGKVNHLTQYYEILLNFTTTLHF